jgi:hypothetical protein
MSQFSQSVWEGDVCTRLAGSSIVIRGLRGLLSGLVEEDEGALS